MRKKIATKSLLSAMMALSLFASTVVTASAEEKFVSYPHKEEVKNYDYLDKYLSDDADLSGTTVILSTNDVHGAIDKYPYAAALKKEFLKKTNNVLLVDCGDFSQDKTSDHTEDSLGCVNATKGAAGVESMNASGYDLATLGNHEFEHGVTALRDNLKKANFQIVCSNIKDSESKLTSNGTPLYVPFKTYDMDSDAGSVRVGFIGLTTHQVGTKEGISFSKKEQLYKDAQDKIDYLKGETTIAGNKIDTPADIIICLSHLGLEDEVKGSRSIDVYENVHGLDVILDGHSHTLISSGDNDEPIMSGEMQLHNIGVIIIDNGSKTITDRFLLSKDGIDVNGDGIGDGNGYYDNLTPDQEALDTIQPIIDQYGKKTEAKEDDDKDDHKKDKHDKDDHKKDKHDKDDHKKDKHDKDDHKKEDKKDDKKHDNSHRSGSGHRHAFGG